MISPIATSRSPALRRKQRQRTTCDILCAPKSSNLRIFMIFLSMTWISYIFWMQRYIDLDQQHRRVALADSLQDFLADISILNRKQSPDAVFYNIFIPRDYEDSLYTSRVVTEQLEQIASALVKHVYYTTMGPSDHELVAKEAVIQGICHRLDLICHNKGHVEGEAENLAHLYEYCADATLLPDESYPDGPRLVSYINSKPRLAHSDTPVNRRLRRILTDAALSEECTNALQQDDQCNVCGLHFAAHHTLYYPGDMWSASCSYIRKLIKPNKFQIALQQVVGDVLAKRLGKDIMTNLYSDDRLGLGQSAMEHWIGSHPDLQPCDVGSETDFFNSLRKQYTLDRFSWRPAPRRLVQDQLWGDTSVLARTEYRLREYYLLPGLLTKWMGLYGILPGQESFAWDVFPDGKFWYLATDKYGLAAVERVLSVESLALTKQDIPDNLPKPAPLYAPVALDAAPPLKTNTTVFYDIYIPVETDAKDVPSELELIQHQIRSMTEASPVTMYYHSMGHDSLEDYDLCASNPGLDCHLLKHYNQQYQGETIRKLSQFCSTNPLSRVAYVHNQIPKHLKQSQRKRDFRMMQALTMGAVSNACFNPDETTCNFCSLIFELQPNHGAMGNIWTANCSYVNALLPLHEFEGRMQRYIGQVLAMNQTGQIVMHDFQANVEHLGLGSYSLSQWAASSPDLVPCDVTPRALSYWSGAEHPSTEFKFSMAPRKHNGLLEIDKELVESMTDDSLRIREYQYLAGRLLKWRMLYGESPGQQSFAWKAYPDASLWRNASSAHGNETVAIVLKQYASTMR